LISQSISKSIKAIKLINQNDQSNQSMTQ